MPVFELVRTNELDDETTTWFRGVLRVIESLDVEAYLECMATDVELVMDHGAQHLRGKEAVGAALGEAWSQLSSLVHNEVNLYGSARHFAHETVTRSVTRDGQEIFTPTCVWVDRDAAGLITSARIY